MVILRNRPIRAPKGRVYSSDPAPPRQRYITPARHRIRSQPSNSAPVKPQRQSTLTQLDFAHIETDSETEDIIEGPARSTSTGLAKGHCDEYDIETSRPAKRKRTSRRSPEEVRKRQQTLTQMDGFLIHDSDSEDVLDLPSEMENKIDERGAQWHNSFMDDDLRIQEDDIATKCSSTHATNPQPSAPAKGLPFKSPAASPHQLRIYPRSEIPSSQSSLQTPLRTTRSNSPTGSPLTSTTRTPLQEIHPNVLATRDSLSVSSEKSKGMKRKIEDVPSTVDSQNEEYLSDNENHMPDSEDEMGMEDLLERSPTKSIKARHLASSPDKLPTPQSLKHTRNLASNSRSEDVENLSSVHSTARTSQATTTDKTSPSSKVRRSPLRRSILPHEMDFETHVLPDYDPLTSSPTKLRFDRSRPMTVDSQYPSSHMDNVTQLASINDTADIITASQMMPSSPID